MLNVGCSGGHGEGLKVRYRIDLSANYANLQFLLSAFRISAFHKVDAAGFPAHTRLHYASQVSCSSGFSFAIWFLVVKFDVFA
jgi:hypothetical protein